LIKKLREIEEIGEIEEIDQFKQIVQRNMYIYLYVWLRDVKISKEDDPVKDMGGTHSDRFIGIWGKLRSKVLYSLPSL
jgi:hypothetical protein